MLAIGLMVFENVLLPVSTRYGRGINSSSPDNPISGTSSTDRLMQRRKRSRLLNLMGRRVLGFSFSHSLVSVIESWLFFGMASEALGRNIRYKEFVGADPDGPHLSIDLRIPEWYLRELKV